MANATVKLPKGFVLDSPEETQRILTERQGFPHTVGTNVPDLGAVARQAEQFVTPSLEPEQTPVMPGMTSTPVEDPYGYGQYEKPTATPKEGLSWWPKPMFEAKGPIRQTPGGGMGGFVPSMALPDKTRQVDAVTGQFPKGYVPKDQKQVDGLITRFMKNIGNLVPEVGQAILTSGVFGLPERETRQYYKQASEELKASGFKGSASQELQQIRNRANQLAAQARIPKIDIPKSANWWEKGTDVAANITKFVTMLKALRAVAPAGTSDALIWEAENQLTGGVPGQGMAMRVALGEIGRIPTGGPVGKTLKVGMESGTFMAVTAAMGGSEEDVIAAGMIPVVFNAYSFAKQRAVIRKFEHSRKSLAEHENNIRLQQVNDTYKQEIQRANQLTDSNAKWQAQQQAGTRRLQRIRSSQTVWENKTRQINAAVEAAKRRIYHDDAFAPAKEKWETERANALKLITKGGESAKRGQVILDFVESTQFPERGLGLPTTRAGEMAETFKGAVTSPVQTIRGALKPIQPPSAAQMGVQVGTPEAVSMVPPAPPTPTPSEISISEIQDQQMQSVVQGTKPAYLADRSSFDKAEYPAQLEKMKQFAKENNLAYGEKRDSRGDMNGVVAKDEATLKKVIEAKPGKELGLALGYEDLRGVTPEQEADFAAEAKGAELEGNIEAMQRMAQQFSDLTQDQQRNMIALIRDLQKKNNDPALGQLADELEKLITEQPAGAAQPSMDEVNSRLRIMRGKDALALKNRIRSEEFTPEQRDQIYGLIGAEDFDQWQARGLEGQISRTREIIEQVGPTEKPVEVVPPVEKAPEAPVIAPPVAVEPSKPLAPTPPAPEGEVVAPAPAKPALEGVAEKPEAKPSPAAEGKVEEEILQEGFIPITENLASSGYVKTGELKGLPIRNPDLPDGGIKTPNLLQKYPSATHIRAVSPKRSYNGTPNEFPKWDTQGVGSPGYEIIIKDGNRFFIGFSENDSIISISEYAVKEKGTGEGSRFAQYLKEYADRTGKKLRIDRVAVNVKFWDKFDWLHKIDDMTYEYVPSSPAAEGKAKQLKDMSIAELEAESEYFDKKIQAEKDRLDKIAPTRQIFSGAGIEYLSQEDVGRMTEVNYELHRRTAISADEARKRVLEKRKARKEESAKQPWEMTREEFDTWIDKVNEGRKWIDRTKQVSNIRRQRIQDALSENQPVPRHVLEEYKDEIWAQKALEETKPEIVKAVAEKAPEEKVIEWEILNSRGQRLGKKTFPTREKAHAALEKRITSPVAQTQFSVEQVKPIESLIGFTPDPTVETEGAGEPGFIGIPGRPGGKIEKPWLDLDKTKSPDKEIEEFFGRTKRPPYSKKASGLIAKLDVGIRERFEFAWHIPKTKENAIFIDMIRTMPEERRAARELAIRHIIAVLDGDGSVKALDAAGLDLLRRKVFTQDLLYEAEIDRSVSGNLAIEKLEAEDKRLDALIDKVPSVKKAYEARQKLWKEVSKDLLERGVLDEEAAKNQTYVRHFVLDLAEKNRPTGFLRKRLSAPYRPYSKHRKGSKRDISTDYLEVETRALADIYADNSVEDAANAICELSEKKFGGRKKYIHMAKAENFENLVGGPDVVERINQLHQSLRETAKQRDKETLKLRKLWIEELTDIDPTYSYRQRIAMHMAKFKKLTYEEGMELEPEEDSALFKDLARAAREQAKEPEGLSARGVFKAMAEREKLIRTSLGKDYVTPERVAARDNFVEYHYKRPNLFYRAQTITQAQIAAFVENTAEEAGAILNIPVEKMHEALVMGRRKGWIIPDWLATQLDDLPVNKRSNYLVRSFSKPFIQFWKRWILRVNPFRYNGRNALGDTERFYVAGQEDATLNIPEALKILFTKEGEEYELMKRLGVVNSTLWHEMNDVSKLKEFERFKNYSKPKTFEALTKRILTIPVRIVSSIGNTEQAMTQYREDILRAAAFLNNYRKLKEGKPVRHWAGKIAHITEIAKDDKARAAAKISRETLGDYGKFTPFENDVIRQGLLPFYSWMKINTHFWVHTPIEAAKEGGLGKFGVRVVPKIGLNIAKWLVRALWIYGVMYLWNHRDEEAEQKEASLPFWLRAMPHVNIGDWTMWGQTALSDFVEWADMERLAAIQWRMDAGLLSKKEAAMEAARVIAEAPVNKVFQALNPFMKAPITAISGMETYPSVFKPHFAASPASRKSLERATLNIMGGDARKFYQTITGDKKFEDTLYAYFAGWFARPMDVDTFLKELERTKEYTTLKAKSKTTGRGPGQAKKGREAEWQEMKIRREAMKKRLQNR